ncbi:MAG: D-2-hydroxyacid dehydrogenase [Flavobacteriaceae bacterium]|tara:strand:- start:97 stop:1047 length:951 start_codon:yes stop_codon:yes gene_type:complete
MKILANDGISANGVEELEAAGFEVSTVTVAQEQLQNYINNEGIVALLVRSATKVRKDLIDACPSLKIIGRGGVGMDNIDVEHARDKGLHVINTPKASSQSVAELVFAHLFSGVRFLYDSNRNMPLDGDSKFKVLKKNYAKGTELRGKTLGVIGFGRIGQATAKIGLGLGMKVVAHDPFMEKASVTVPFFDGQSVTFDINIESKETVLKQADFLSLHVPAQKEFVIGAAEIELMKDGAGLVNAARGGVVDEVAMVESLKSGKLGFAGLDTFENEPNPAVQVLMTPNVSLTPHIGAATTQAQKRIGSELATQIISILK